MACITRLRAPLRTLTLTARVTPALARANSTLAPGSSQDPSHPHLYYHPSPTGATTPTHMTLSFLPRPPAVASSKCVLGTLPALPDAGLNDFVENRAFRPLLHAALKDGLATAGVAETVEYEAQMRPGDGYMHVTDERAVPPAGRIGDTEDLIASVFVQDGKIVASTYEPSPSYRLVTNRGVLLLPRGLDTHVIKALEKVDAEERGE
ncbi:uncharacterized protein EHS24_007259 [Apiotrichum porosum]|uniref:Uncharacterized protein n=1 Tax=Apiotrichum porosum TaxID=105984 RepID=A0A427XXM5_9TREE|nr:uncharacterized protein EHS24_007259 [Apiotrichum porosum]RSH83571.1 hypothetical protein EHS24_007259 [Apiotrichum porosum]